MRNITELTVEEMETLKEGHRNSAKYRFRNRCHSILLSFNGVKVSTIADFHNVQTRTVYTWFDSWEDYGISGLISLPGRGVKSKLDSIDEQQIEQVKKAVANRPQSLKKVSEEIGEILGFKVSKQMLKRLLKKN